jgi:NADP-dependent 3-hydroxy acid dehydrogenase YdfG
MVVKEGKAALPAASNMRDLTTIDALMEKAVVHYHKIDILVNNAGTVVTKPAGRPLKKNGISSYI